jgi:hypothetical protein
MAPAAEPALDELDSQSQDVEDWEQERFVLIFKNENIIKQAISLGKVDRKRVDRVSEEFMYRVHLLETQSRSYSGAAS